MITPPVTRYCSECKKTLPLSHFKFVLHKKEGIHPSKQCLRHHPKMVTPGWTACNVLYATIWRLVTICYISPCNVPRELRERKERLDPAKILALIKASGTATDDEHDAIIYREMERQAAEELDDILWQNWFK